MSGGGTADIAHPLATPGQSVPATRHKADLRISAGLTYAVAATIGALLTWHCRVFYHDDAFVSLRYVARLLAGEGLTWNPWERVEGFTHPLWLAQLAALGWLGVELPTASRLLGFAYYAGIFALWRAARASPLLLVVAATLPGIVVWCGSGLETVSFGLWLTLAGWLSQAAYWESERDHTACRTAALAGFALGLAALTRPEGAGAALIVLASLTWKRHWVAVGGAAVTFTATFGAYEVFRLLYYGTFVSNSAVAKLGGLSMGDSLVNGLYYFWTHRPTWVPAVAISVLAFALANARAPLVLLSVSLPVFASSLLAGGDHMIAGRLIAPGVLVIIFAVAIAIREKQLQHPFIVHTVLVGVVLWQVTFLAITPFDRDPAAAVGEPVGQWLESALPANAVVAAATAGSTPYFAPSLTFIDTLGLNDRHIAARRTGTVETAWQKVPGHHKGDGAYVLSRAPDVIILGPADGFAGARPRAWFLTDYELLQSAEFHARYRGYKFPITVTASQARAPAVKRRLRGNHTLMLTAFVRVDSPAATALAARGEPLSDL